MNLNQNDRIRDALESTIRYAAIIALSLAFAAAWAACGAERTSEDVRIRFDQFEPGLLYYAAPPGAAYHIMGSEDLDEWRFLDTSVMRGWSAETPVWFRHAQPERYFQFVKDADFEFPGWDDLEDFELRLAVRPLTIRAGMFKVAVYSNLSPMPQDGSRGEPWARFEGSLEQCMSADGALHISSEAAWEVQMAGIAWWQIVIELDGWDGRHAEIVVGKHLSDALRGRWPYAPQRDSALGIEREPVDWALGYSLMEIDEEEEEPFAE